MGPWQLFHTTVPEATLFRWGPIALHWYGLLFALAVLVGYLVVRREWREHTWPILELDQLLAWLVLTGLLGARLLDVFWFEWWYFRQHLSALWRIWEGGLAFHGGVLVGAITLWLWARQHKRSWLAIADTFAPALALGQAIGRWGNYFNQELFGLPTNLPWGIPIVRLFRPAAYATASYFHPVFLYESLALIAIALGLWQVRKRNLVPGQRFALYLATTGLLRFALEFVRVDEQVAQWGVRAGTWVALVTVLFGAALWWQASRSVQPKPTPAA